jgi:hypothetical protein
LIWCTEWIQLPCLYCGDITLLSLLQAFRQALSRWQRMQLNLSVLWLLKAARRPGVPPTTEASAFLMPGSARRVPVAEGARARTLATAGRSHVLGASSSRFRSTSPKKKGGSPVACTRAMGGRHSHRSLGRMGSPAAFA